MKKRCWFLSLICGAISLSGLTSVSANAEDLAGEAKKDSKNCYEYIDYSRNKYFEDPNGAVWEFNNIYSFEEGVEPTYDLLEMSYCKGVVCRKYTGSEEPFYVQDYDTMFTWDAEGTYEFEGETYKYNLVSPLELMISDRVILKRVIVKTLPEIPDKITYYDYNKDGKLRIDDLVALNKRYSATPMNFVTNLDLEHYREMLPEDFFKILRYYEENGEEEVWIRYGDTVPEVTTTTTTTMPTTTLTTTTTTTTEKPTTTSTTTTAKPTTTSTTTTTTTTAKPTTTSTTTTTTTTVKPTTTSTTTMTTTTAKPTTTSTTTTTTTAKPTTTSTTTTTTTTEKPTTTSTTTTTTTEKPTTTSTTTTTTTEKPTTTSTTTTTTTEPTTTTTTSTTVGSWTQPKEEDLIHDGEQINSDTYKILINTAETFGINQYKIVWSDTPIEYAYTDPGLYYCMKNGVSYGYGVQIAPSQDISTLCPEMKKLVQAEYKQNEFICFRPVIDDDNLKEVLKGFEVTDSAYKNSNGIVVMAINEGTDFEGNIAYNVFSSSNWYLVPLDENEQELYELNCKDAYNLTQTSVEKPRYWFTNTELSPGDKEMPKERFYEFLATAETLGLENMKFVNSNDIQYYGFAMGYMNLSGLYTVDYKGVAQIIPATDLLIVEPDRLEQYLKAGYSESSAKLLIEDDTNPEVHPYYAWIPKELLIINSDSFKEDDREIYVFTDTTYEVQHLFATANNDLWWMIPTDADENEVLKVWYPLDE